jgi:hypothetical protein
MNKIFPKLFDNKYTLPNRSAVPLIIIGAEVECER